MAAHRILVADDNADSAESMALLLGFDGHEVRCATDGVEALRLYEEFRPDVVVLDISMPLMDGYEVARRIRALDPLRHPLLIAVSGWARGSDVERIAGLRIRPPPLQAGRARRRRQVIPALILSRG